MALTTYTIPLDGVSPDNFSAIAELLDNHADYFEGYILAAFGGDTTYSIVPGSFQATISQANHANYRAMVHYFAPCRDIDRQDPVTGNFSYQIIDGRLVISLDETLWVVE